ncbi:hypothetical protein KIN20_006041 [Parelaphostrongylus tenuis]|uniref:Uncharacterized protein n=1 Tax=Parelaphostrongylus tenuis TaxID=148309 RepID=A0AAD5M126_PARTN|nr:hypothetical protein KIN20_006041 [Parelaphostrongylus tenuis]
MKTLAKPAVKSNKPPIFKGKRTVVGSTYSTGAKTPASAVSSNLREIEVTANQNIEELVHEDLEEVVKSLVSEVMSKVETEIVCENPVKVVGKSIVESGDNERPRM